jgi:predicted DNA-binding transcriptional regulator AlpA
MISRTNDTAIQAVGDYLLDRRGVALVLGMSPAAINVARHRGTFALEPVRIGSRLRWRASDVRRWIADGGDTPTPAAGR